MQSHPTVKMQLIGTRVPWKVFPFISASALGSTISILLIHWLASGRPMLRSMMDPRIAFISDLGAYTLKPLFIAGTIITTLSFWAVLYRVHMVTFSAEPRDTVRRLLSAQAVIAGFLGSLALVLLSIFDVYQIIPHLACLVVFCPCMVISAVCTAAWDWRWNRTSSARRGGAEEAVEANGDESSRGHGLFQTPMRWYCQNAVITLIFTTSVLFLVVRHFAPESDMLIRGIMEWCIAALMVAYLGMLGYYMK